MSRGTEAEPPEQNRRGRIKHRRRPPSKCSRDLAAQCEDDRSRQHDNDDRDAGKEKSFLRRSAGRRPERQKVRGLHERCEVAAELAHLVERAVQPQRVVDLFVVQERRHEQQGRQCEGEGERRASAPGVEPVDEPQQPEADEDREEQQIVAVRQRLQEPGGREDREPARPSLVDPCVHRKQRQRHPLRREYLQVRELARTIGRQREGESGDDAGEGGTCEPASEREGEEAGEPAAGDHRHVVGGDRTDAGELQRRREDGDAGQVL